MLDLHPRTVAPLVVKGADQGSQGKGDARALGGGLGKSQSLAGLPSVLGRLFGKRNVSGIPKAAVEFPAEDMKTLRWINSALIRLGFVRPAEHRGCE